MPPPRLFYVAITRAKDSLTVLSHGKHPLVLLGDESILPRTVHPDGFSIPQARLRYHPPDPMPVDLSFAGRLPETHPMLAAIAAARPGDPVTLVSNGDRWEVCDALGQTLTRLSRAFAPPERATFRRGEVSAVLLRRKRATEAMLMRGVLVSASYIVGPVNIRMIGTIIIPFGRD